MCQTGLFCNGKAWWYSPNREISNLEISKSLLDLLFGLGRVNWQRRGRQRGRTERTGKSAMWDMGVGARGWGTIGGRDSNNNNKWKQNKRKERNHSTPERKITTAWWLQQCRAVWGPQRVWYHLHLRCEPAASRQGTGPPCHPAEPFRPPHGRATRGQSFTK